MHQVNEIMGPSGPGLYWFTRVGADLRAVWVRSNLRHCSTVTSLAAMANRRGMITRRGVSIVTFRFGSVGGDPMRNSTGPSITA